MEKEGTTHRVLNFWNEKNFNPDKISKAGTVPNPKEIMKREPEMGLAAANDPMSAMYTIPQGISPFKEPTMNELRKVLYLNWAEMECLTHCKKLLF